MNKLKEEIPVEEKQEKKTDTKGARKMVNVLNGSFISKDNVVELLPFLLFVSFIGILYISNRYYSEKNVFRMNSISNELKELRSEYITTKSELMFRSKQSEVAKAVEETGLKESVVPPKKIVVTENELSTKN